MLKHEYLSKKIPGCSPNYFFYVCPTGLINPEEIPPYAGLIYVEGEEVTYIVDAPRLHRHKPDLIKLQAKVLRLYQERAYLGGARLTYENRLHAAKIAEIEKQYPDLFRD